MAAGDVVQGAALTNEVAMWAPNGRTDGASIKMLEAGILGGYVRYDSALNQMVVGMLDSGPTDRESIRISRTNGRVSFLKETEFTEMTDPSAPAANTAVLYCRDNGSGKTQLCARFATGAVQVIATQP